MESNIHLLSPAPFRASFTFPRDHRVGQRSTRHRTPYRRSILQTATNKLICQPTVNVFLIFFCRWWSISVWHRWTVKPTGIRSRRMRNPFKSWWVLQEFSFVGSFVIARGDNTIHVLHWTVATKETGRHQPWRVVVLCLLLDGIRDAFLGKA